ncbi:hypothetical protein N7537_003254 [Penicillium hordei]|uniref:Uncharacterized protein n=1 Tax=Penicillium hordei TaxID=40994 RepID=A0AAD6H9N3_9EURO|nr:uncharacterized protein N7537_003254 [Penicillium hordei]KAJ5618140.1 hypothetical protein N7537_003254 [Penicillium hordei]
MEAAGYMGRILMHDNPWSTSGFRLQIFCLILAPTFIAAALDFFIASRKHLREDLQGEAVTEKPQRKVCLVLAAELAAYITVLIRCIYRLPEMAGGWGNELMQSEMDFLVLDGMMVALACLVFTVVHPGLYLPTMGTGRSHW